MVQTQTYKMLDWVCLEVLAPSPKVLANDIVERFLQVEEEEKVAIVTKVREVNDRPHEVVSEIRAAASNGAALRLGQELVVGRSKLGLEGASKYLAKLVRDNESCGVRADLRMTLAFPHLSQPASSEVDWGGANCSDVQE
jgi:hypothetical protein